MCAVYPQVWLESELCQLDSIQRGDEMRRLLVEAADELQADLRNREYALSVMKAFADRIIDARLKMD